MRPQIVLWHIHWFEIQRLVRACVGEQFHDFINRFSFDSKGEQDSTCLFSRRVGLYGVRTGLRFGMAELNSAVVQGVHADVYKHTKQFGCRTENADCSNTHLGFAIIILRRPSCSARSKWVVGCFERQPTTSKWDTLTFDPGSEIIGEIAVSADVGLPFSCALFIAPDRESPSTHSELVERGALMTPVASKKLSKFDPKTFLSTLDGGRKIAAFPKNRRSSLKATRPIPFFIFKKEK